MTLRRWIIKTGPKEVARKLKVDPSTVSNWKCGTAFPRRKQLIKINRASKGEVTYTEMIEKAGK